MNDWFGYVAVFLLCMICFIGGFSVAYNFDGRCYKIYNSNESICIYKKGNIDNISVFTYKIEREKK